MINRLLFITSFLLLSSMQLIAQQYTYIYDAAGNRTKVTLLKSSLANQDTTDTKKPVLVIDQNREFKLYPNPTKGHVTIECPGLPDGTNVICTIYDASGRLISNAVYNRLQRIRCDLSDAPNGLYIFNIKLPDSQHVLKVLKD